METYNLTSQSVNGTSYHRTTVDASFAQLEAIFGPPNGECEGKPEWALETSTGVVLTIYAHYCTVDPRALGVVSWNIGSKRGGLEELDLALFITERVAHLGGKV